VPWHGFQEDLVQDLARHRGETGWQGGRELKILAMSVLMEDVGGRGEGSGGDELNIHLSQSLMKAFTFIIIFLYLLPPHH